MAAESPGAAVATQRAEPPPRLAFVGPWGRLRLLCGPALARSAAQLAFAALALAAMARCGVALGAPAAPVRGVLQLVLLIVLYPVLSSSRVTKALAAVALGRPGAPPPLPAASRLRFDLRPLGDAAAAERCAELLASGAFPGAGCAPEALRALARAGAVPPGTLLLEVFASPKPAAASGNKAAAPQTPGGPSPHRLLALVLARVVPRVSAAPLLGGLATHPLLPGGEFDAALLEVPLTGWPAVFVTHEVKPRDAAAITTAAVRHLLSRLGLAAAVLPPPAGGAVAPFASAAMAAAGAHAVPPALGAPDDTFVLTVPPALRGCGSLDAFAANALRRSLRRDLRAKRRRFALAGGTVAVVPSAEVFRDDTLASLLLGADAAAGTAEPQLALALAALARDDAASLEARPPDALLAGAQGGALPGALAAALLRAEPRCCWALVARAPGGAPAAAALLLRDAATKRLCIRRVTMQQPLARTSGASAALLRGALELALVLGVDAVDLGPGAAGGAKTRLGAVAMPRTPLLLFADDRLAAAAPAPGALYGGLLREARDALQAGPPAAETTMVPGGGKRAQRRARRRMLRLGAAAERARDAARLADAAGAEVDGDAVSALDACSDGGDASSSAFSSAMSA
jgi:hypothetical protein